MRRAAKVDENQSEIVKALRKLGASVADTSRMGQGFPDLVCGFRGNNYLIEVKNEKQPPSKRKLTDDEKRFHDGWCGSVHVVETVEQAINLMTFRGEE